jgi:hypothetical protein
VATGIRALRGKYYARFGRVNGKSETPFDGNAANASGASIAAPEQSDPLVQMSAGGFRLSFGSAIGYVL